MAPESAPLPDALAPADATNRRLRRHAAIGLGIVAAALMTEERLRLGVSASVPEFAAYIAMLLVLRAPAPRARIPGAANYVIATAALLGLLLARAVYLRLFRAADVESAFGHLRNEAVPVVLAVLLLARLRLDARALARLQWTLVIAGAAAGLLGIAQFAFGGPYPVDGIEFIQYKTKVAKTYMLADLLGLKVDHLARGLYGFSLSYAASLLVPAMLSFALALRTRGRARSLAALATFVMGAGIYLSFSRSIVLVLPFGWALVALTIHGGMRLWMPVTAAVGYLLVAFVGPHLRLAFLEDVEMGTLTARADTVAGLARMIHRDPGILLHGTTLTAWQQYEDLAPHNFLANAILEDGIPITALRLAIFLALFARLAPRSGDRNTPLTAGLWCGGYTLLFIVGQTEPFGGISFYLLTGYSLALLAAASPPRPPVEIGAALRPPQEGPADPPRSPPPPPIEALLRSARSTTDRS